VVDKMALGQVFSEYFGFPCLSSFHQLLHNHPHLSSGAVQLVRSGRSTWWRKSHPTQRKKFEWSPTLVGYSGVSEWVRGPLGFSRCELLLLEAASWGTGTVREPRGRGTSTVGSRYQATTGEDTADWKDLLRAVVNCSVCELTTTL
jgi:hypothetical protein